MMILPLLLSCTTSVDAPRGHYVEARTASVYAGACHYGAEATTAGREAILVWRFEGGRFQGVDLEGTVVAAVIVGDENLADPKVVRRSRLYVSKGGAAAALELVRSRNADVLGEVRSVETVPLTAVFEGESYRAQARGIFAIDGARLPDRACCKMPYNVWYAPFALITGKVVGCNRTFEFADKRLGLAWSRHDENTSWVGSFEIAPALKGP